MDRVASYFDPEPPAQEEVTKAFWLACHGGQQSAAEFLLARGADINWIGYDTLTPLDAARRSGANELVAWLFHRSGKSANDSCL
jgi:ankyrin repeat protein